MKKIKMADFASSVLQILGLKEWKTENDKKTLDEADITKLKSFGFTDTFINAFSKSLADDFKDESEDDNQGEPAAPSVSAQAAIVNGLLAQQTAKLADAMQQIEAMEKTNTDNTEALKQKNEEINTLKGRIEALGKLPEQTHPNQTLDNPMAINLQDENQLCGWQGEMFAMEGRPYNLRARATLLAREGISLQVNAESSTDYSRLKEDLGAFYRVRWQDRLQSFLVKLPTIEAIFPLESGYQDLATLVNIWLGEFSQADNTIDSDFDKVTKGHYEFDSETLRMYSVMFVHKFRNLKELERTWIGSLNREGSQVIKWSFIEYILAETAKKLHNERELRRINGARRDPNVNEAGRAMEAADGIYEFIRKKVDGYMDINKEKVVYQIKPFELGEITEVNIGEKFFEGTSMIPAVYRDSGQLALYVPSYMVVWYHKYNELHYGVNQDYKANMMYVKEYPSVKLIPVPNADNHTRIIWTMQGNIKCFEHVPGEMTRFNIEQQDWTLKVWSNWKESVWARAVGYKYTKKADMDYSRQMIFCNEMDRPASSFIDAEKDKNPSAAIHTSIQTVANTQEFAITDIEGAEVGRLITLKCGSVDKGVKIEKSGKFELISAAWTPAVGDTIKLMKRADGKFIEISRASSTLNMLRFDDNATTPDVSEGNEFATSANTEATAITNFTGAKQGEVYTIHGAGSTNASTIANSGNFVLTNAMTLKEGAMIRLVFDGKKFYEVERR